MEVEQNIPRYLTNVADTRTEIRTAGGQRLGFLVFGEAEPRLQLEKEQST
jgi:hypothetical protein